MPIIVSIVLSLMVPVNAYAIFDFIGDTAKDIAEASAYTDAVSELLDEIDPDTAVSDGARDLDQRMKMLRSEVGGANLLSQETRGILSGPNWTDQRLYHNIRATTHYVRRVKRLLLKLGALGTSGSTAFNTFETNMNLQEVQKNQQAALLQDKEFFVAAQMEKERERATWRKFIDEQRKTREGAK